ncbi:hypothetical protein Bca4012_024164 [Brassica carinata]
MGARLATSGQEEELGCWPNLFNGNLTIIADQIMRDPDTMNSHGFGFTSYGSFDEFHAAIEAKIQAIKEKLTSLWSENITEAARDSYEKANQEISSDKLKLAEEKAITKEQNKMRAEEAAHAMTEKMRRVVERDIKNQRKGRTKKPKQNKKNATTSRSKLKKRLTKIHKKKTSLGKIAIGKDMVVSYSQAGLGTDKEREEKRRYFTIC